MGLNKGQTNNRNGRPIGSKNQTTRQIKELIDNSIDSEELINELEKLTKDTNSRTRLEAIKLILAYRYGKPTEYVELTSSEDNQKSWIVQYVDDSVGSEQMIRFEQYLKENNIEDTTYSEWVEQYHKENAKDLDI